MNLSTLGFFRNKAYGITFRHYGNGRIDFKSHVGVRLMLQPVRYASTATANQPDFGSDNEDDEILVTKKRKEASPEECDQAVVGLSTAKAKAKAKQLEEPQKVAKSILWRLWARLLGIGPAFRAVISMSRLDCSPM